MLTSLKKEWESSKGDGSKSKVELEARIKDLEGEFKGRWETLQKVEWPQVDLQTAALWFALLLALGVQVVGVQLFGVDSASFWSQMRSSVSMDDIMEGVIKGCVFGFACSLVAVYEGYTAIATAEGVGRATTRTVVISAVLTLMLDYMLTAVML